MFTKISVLKIIKDHILTLKNNQTKKISYLDIILFFIVPLIVSGIMVYLGIFLNDSLVNALITSFSIFSALLFNLLLLVYDISEKDAKSTNSQTNSSAPKKNNIRQTVIKEIYINVSFSILVSLTTVVILITYFLKPSNCIVWIVNICSVQWLLALVIYYCVILFILTLLMILKRIYKLLAQEF
jgi:hypothetical protein